MAKRSLTILRLFVGAIIVQISIVSFFGFDHVFKIPSETKILEQLHASSSPMSLLLYDYHRRRNTTTTTTTTTTTNTTKSTTTSNNGAANINRRPSQEEMNEYMKQFPKLIYDGKKAECNQKRCLLFMHIGKSGGMSFNKWTKAYAESIHRPYHGRHFDWSFIEALGNNTDVIMLLRHPVKRAISHFYFHQDAPWGNEKLKNLTTLTDYFQSKPFLLETRDIWQDGQASVSWLTGTHIASWAGIPKQQIVKRERLATENITMLLHLAADRLEKTLWFGILEDLERSMELLQHALGLEERPHMDPTVNRNKREHPKATEEEEKELASLMPQDLWLYAYGLRLFEARWTAYKTGQTLIVPDRPPIPELSCFSSRFKLNCTSGPFKGAYYWFMD